MGQTDREWQDLDLAASRVFTPTSPIDERELFAGRDEQVRTIIDVINQKGQHAMLYGERGVGKTSLANVLSSFLGRQEGSILAPRVNCDSTDTFGTVWRKVFDEIELIRETRPERKTQLPLFRAPRTSEYVPPDEITPDVVRRSLVLLARGKLPILIIDEFDRLPDEPRRAFADTIKTLSDHAVGATVILVGVADSVEQLLEEHLSVERALVQVRMPRMSTQEIESIVANGVTRLGMSIQADANERISRLSQGLPHYAHLLALHACRAAITGRRRRVEPIDVRSAIRRALEGTQQSVRKTYHDAVRSQRKDSLFADVLLACAMARTNELGFFAALDVRDPIRQITGRDYDIPSFAQHLNEFCDEKRGSVLHKDGERRRFRYRFQNPLMQPFVIMRGIDEDRIDVDDIG